METWLIPVIVSLITALGVTIPGIYTARRQARKDRVDSAATISDSVLEQLAFYRQEVNDLRTKYKQEVTELQTKVETLECDLLNEREKRRDLEHSNSQKDQTIAAMQVEIDDLRGQVEALQRKRQH